MIDFRYHLVSLVSVFLALAVGIVLGAGPLKGTIGDTLSSQVDQLRSEKAALRGQLDIAQAAVENRDTFARTVLPSLVHRQLGGGRVLFLALPGASTDSTKPLAESLQAAGARVTGRVDLKDAWTDPAHARDRDSVLRTFASLLATGTSGPASSTPAAVSSGPTAKGSATNGSASPASASPAPTAVPVPSVPGATSTATALAALLARALVTRDPGQTGPLDPDAARTIDGMRRSGLLGINGDLTGRASQVVVLAPGVEPAAGGQSGSSTAASPDPMAQWAALAVGLDARSQGAVVVGPASSATPGGVLSALRAQDVVSQVISTVDSGGTPMGDVTTVLALHEQSLGGAGSYGFVGKVKAPLPVLSEVGRS
jgi:hypothetical protein